jgi:hypothetical protein
MQYILDVPKERGILIVGPDERQYCHDTKRVFKRKSADDQPIKWQSRLCLKRFQAEDNTRLLRKLPAHTVERVFKTVRCSNVLVQLPMRPDRCG